MSFDFKKIFGIFANFMKALTAFMKNLGLGKDVNKEAIDTFMDDVETIVNGVE